MGGLCPSSPSREGAVSGCGGWFEMGCACVVSFCGCSCSGFVPDSLSVCEAWGGFCCCVSWGGGMHSAQMCRCPTMFPLRSRRSVGLPIFLSPSVMVVRCFWYLPSQERYPGRHWLSVSAQKNLLHLQHSAVLASFFCIWGPDGHAEHDLLLSSFVAQSGGLCFLGFELCLWFFESFWCLGSCLCFFPFIPLCPFRFPSSFWLRGGIVVGAKVTLACGLVRFRATPSMRSSWFLDVSEDRQCAHMWAQWVGCPP